MRVVRRGFGLVGAEGDVSRQCRAEREGAFGLLTMRMLDTASLSWAVEERFLRWLSCCGAVKSINSMELIMVGSGLG